jgi:hypothetical protein
MQQPKLICFILTNNIQTPIQYEVVHILKEIEFEKGTKYDTKFSNETNIVLMYSNSSYIWLLKFINFGNEPFIVSNSIKLPNITVDKLFWISFNKIIIKSKNEKWYILEYVWEKIDYDVNSESKSNLVYKLYSINGFQKLKLLTNSIKNNELFSINENDVLQKVKINYDSKMIEIYDLFDSNNENRTVKNSNLCSNKKLIGHSGNELIIFDLLKETILNIKNEHIENFDLGNIISSIELPNDLIATLSDNQSLFLWEVDYEKLKNESIDHTDLIGYEKNENSDEKGNGKGFGDGEGEGEGNGDGEGNGNGTGSGNSSSAGGGMGDGSYNENIFEVESAPSKSSNESIENQKNISKEVKEKAIEMSKEALSKKLKEIDMSEQQLSVYNGYYNRVKKQIKQMRVLLENLRSKEKERVWMKNKLFGEIDDNKIIEGIFNCNKRNHWGKEYLSKKT